MRSAGSIDALDQPSSQRSVAALVEVVDVGESVQIAIARHLDDDANPLLWESPLILAITRDKAGQRGSTVLFLAPDDHHLETAIEDERIGKPALPQRALDPRSAREHCSPER